MFTNGQMGRNSGEYTYKEAEVLYFLEQLNYWKEAPEFHVPKMHYC